MCDPESTCLMDPARNEASSNIEQAKDDDHHDGGAEVPVRLAVDVSAPRGVLSAQDVEVTVHEILDSTPGVSPQPPPRYAMENMVSVDDEIMDVLRAFPLSEDTLSHVEHVVEMENTSCAAAKGSFAARVFRQRPGVIYAVR